MVPSEFHEFFLSAAGVAGALIGLLFVAVSIRPEQLNENERTHIRMQPLMALCAFLDTLVISLLALLPDYNLGAGSVALGAVGLATIGAIAVTLVQQFQRSDARRHTRTLLSVAGQGAVYVLQLMSGIDLLRDPQHTSAVGTQAVILILLFAFGIDRAWALIGGLSTRHARALARRQHPTPQWDLSRSGTIDRTRTNP